VKDAGEVARIRAACSIADAAFANVAGRLAARPTEVEFGLDLEFEMRRLGAAAMSFEPIVGLELEVTLLGLDRMYVLAELLELRL